MNYPIEILPNENYKLIDCDLSNYHLIRYTNSSVKSDYYNEETKIISSKAISDPSTNMYDLSCSLYDVFTIKHIHIQILNKEYFQYCSPKTIVPVPEFETDFTFNGFRGRWFVLISEIDGQVATYNRENTTLNAKCVVLHTPMRWNYWHYSITWYIEEVGKYWKDLEPHERNPKWNQRLGHETRTLLQRLATWDLPEIVPLPKHCYIDQDEIVH